MEGFNKLKLPFGAIRCYYSTATVPKPPVSRFNRPLPLIGQPNSSISFQNLNRSCGFSSSSYFRQRSALSGHVNQFYCSKRFFSSPEGDALIFFVPVVSLIGFLLFLYLGEVPYTRRRRFLMWPDVESRKLGEIWLRDARERDFKGEILPANDPRCVKVSSILQNVLDTLYKDLGLDEIPRVSYHGSAEPNEKGTTDTIFEQIRRKSRGWRTDISHLKGRNWQFLVVDDPEKAANSYGDGIIVVCTDLLDRCSDLGIAIVLAHEVGHCAARHHAEAMNLLSFVKYPFDKQTSKLLYTTPRFEPFLRRTVTEADYISLLLMASAGYDPHVVLQEYEKFKAFYPADKEKFKITMEERIQLLSQLHVMEEASAIYSKTTADTVTETNEKGIIFEQIRRKSSGERTDISHLKGKNWQFLVVDGPEKDAYSYGDGIIAVCTGLLDRCSDLGIAIVLAHEVGHCVARHSAEANGLLSYDDSPFDKKTSKVLYLTRCYEPFIRRAIKETDYISLLLIASAGYDPHVVLQEYEKLKAFYPADKEKLSKPHVM